MEKQILNLFKYSRNTYYVWKREKRPIIKLLEKYFNEEELEEFIEKGTISKLEYLEISSYIVFSKYIKYIDKVIFDSNDAFKRLKNKLDNDVLDLKADELIDEIISSIPIFIFMSYIYKSNEKSVNYNEFASSLIKIISNNKISKNNNYTNLLSINIDLFYIFKYFMSCGNFNKYYYDTSDTIKEISEHEFFDELYINLNEIKNSTIDDNKKKEQIIKILNHDYKTYKKIKEFEVADEWANKHNHKYANIYANVHDVPDENI